MSIADIDRRGGHVRFVPKCMARPRGARRISESDERESCINVSGLFVEHLLLRTIMGIRAHPG
jgi:hypothetical protein